MNTGQARFDQLYEEFYASGGLHILDNFVKGLILVKYQYKVPNVEELYDEYIDHLTLFQDNDALEEHLDQISDRELSRDLVFYSENRGQMARYIERQGVYPTVKNFEDVYEEMGIEGYGAN